MYRHSTGLAQYLLLVVILLPMPSMALGAGPTVTTLRDACSGVFPAGETRDQLSCVRYVKTIQNEAVLSGSLCEPGKGFSEATAIGLWFYLGQFPGNEPAEPFVLDFLQDSANCARVNVQ